MGRLDHAAGGDGHPGGDFAHRALAGVSRAPIATGDLRRLMALMMKKISPTQFASWLTLAILLTLSWLLPNRTAFSAQAAQRKTEIAAAMDDVPLIIGRWVGAEV